MSNKKAFPSLYNATNSQNDCALRERAMLTPCLFQHYQQLFVNKTFNDQCYVKVSRKINEERRVLMTSIKCKEHENILKVSK